MEPIYYYYYYYFNYIVLQGYKSPPKKGETQIFYQTPHYLRFLLLFLSLNISKASYQEKEKSEKGELMTYFWGGPPDWSTQFVRHHN